MRIAGSERYPVAYYDRQIDNSYLEPIPDPGDARRFRLLGIVCACLFTMVFGLLMFHIRCRHYGYEIARLQAESAQLKVSNQKWELEIARLTDPQTIDRLARQDLGFEPSTPQQMVRVGSAEPLGLTAGAHAVASNSKVVGRMQEGSVREPKRNRGI
ncbi:MAG: septum formation initiator family protein [Acidobacteriota bacterium]|nr:septum formation initiator family protein [Acidobacteriota bacterium]